MPTITPAAPFVEKLKERLKTAAAIAGGKVSSDPVALITADGKKTTITDITLMDAAQRGLKTAFYVPATLNKDALARELSLDPSSVAIKPQEEGLPSILSLPVTDLLLQQKPLTPLTLPEINPADASGSNTLAAAMAKGVANFRREEGYKDKPEAEKDAVKIWKKDSTGGAYKRLSDLEGGSIIISGVNKAIVSSLLATSLTTTDGIEDRPDGTVKIPINNLKIPAVGASKTPNPLIATHTGGRTG